MAQSFPNLLFPKKWDPQGYSMTMQHRILTNEFGAICPFSNHRFAKTFCEPFAKIDWKSMRLSYWTTPPSLITIPKRKKTLLEFRMCCYANGKMIKFRCSIIFYYFFPVYINSFMSVKTNSLIFKSMNSVLLDWILCILSSLGYSGRWVMSRCIFSHKMLLFSLRDP